MTRGKTRILGAVIMLATFIFASTFFMSKPKAAAAEEFPSANLENVTVHNVAHEDDSAVPPVYKENKTETIETKEPANVEVAVEAEPTCQHSWEHSHQSPTCKNEGYEKDTCTLCGEERVTILPCCSHVEGEWIITVQPTEYADGVRLKDCIYCDIILYFENFRQIVKTIVQITLEAIIQQAFKYALKWLKRKKERRVEKRVFFFVNYFSYCYSSQL